MDEKFGADCNHEGQSFICEPCAAAQLAEAMAELSEQESRANRWMTGCQLAREQLAEARLALRLIDIEGVDQRVRDITQAALEVEDG